MKLKEHKAYLDQLCKYANEWAESGGRSLSFSVSIDDDVAFIKCNNAIAGTIVIVEDLQYKNTGMVASFDYDGEILGTWDVTDGVPRLYHAYGNEVRTITGLEMAFEEIQDLVERMAK